MINVVVFRNADNSRLKVLYYLPFLILFLWMLTQLDLKGRSKDLVLYIAVPLFFIAVHFLFKYLIRIENNTFEKQIRRRKKELEKYVALFFFYLFMFNVAIIELLAWLI